MSEPPPGLEVMYHSMLPEGSKVDSAEANTAVAASMLMTTISARMRVRDFFIKLHAIWLEFKLMAGFNLC